MPANVLRRHHLCEQSGAGRGAQDIFSLADCSLDIPDESPELAKLAKLPRLIAQ